MATFNYTGSIQYFTVPAGGAGEYQIDAFGAQGGHEFADSDNLGAAVSGEIFLAAGAKLEIVVGGEGGSAGLGSHGLGGAGGGGGSFVIETFNGSEAVNILEAVAGGGGGADMAGGPGSGSSGDGGGPGLAAPTGGHGSGGLGGGAAGGIDGAGGGAGAGGGGGGYTGGAGGNFETNPGNGLVGDSFAGGAGGAAGPFGGNSGGAGGFGGGGGGGSVGGGGGGGYGGESQGGGGGSYLNSSLTSPSESANAHPDNGEVTIALVCFVTGSRIRTRRGEVAVEGLAVGDLAVTATGEARPIRWIGHRRIERPTRDQWPVRVMAGAFGEGLPERDLFLSPGHAVCVEVVDEVFVPVDHLINGVTIFREAVAEVTYWHVELESHDVLLAEGMPCESYMDAGNRAFFGREYGRLETIDPGRVAESLTRYARPFVDQGPIVAAIGERLAAKAAAMRPAETERQTA